MKKIISLVLIFLFVCSYSQILVKYKYDGENYIIKYEPLNNKCCKDAKVYVYKLVLCRCVDIKYDTILIGEQFIGIYLGKDKYHKQYIKRAIITESLK